MTITISRGDSYTFEVSRPDGVVIDGYACEYAVVDRNNNATGLLGTITDKNQDGTAFVKNITPDESQLLNSGWYHLCTRLSYNDSYSLESKSVLTVEPSCFFGSLIVQSFGAEFTSEFT